MNMLKQKLKSKKGFTLIELLIAIAVFSIFSVSALSVMVPVMNTYNQVNDAASANLICSTVINTLRDDISCANSAPQIGAAGSKLTVTNKYGIVEFFCSDNDAPTSGTAPSKGYLYRNDVHSGTLMPVFDKGFYGKMTVNIWCAIESDGVVSVVVTVYQNGETVVSQTTFIEPISLKG